LSESSTTVETVEDEDDAELEKLIDSTEDDLDDAIAYKSLSTVTVPNFVVNGIATSDVLGDDYYGDDHETNCDATVTAGVNKIDNNESIFYDEIRAQMDGGAKVSVTNLLMLLHNVKFYSSKFKCKIRMHSATSKTIMQPLAEGYLRVPAMTSEGYVDVLCYYSPQFTSTLLSDLRVCLAAGSKYMYSQNMMKFFAPNEELLQADLASGKVNLDNTQYNFDYGNCLLTCTHRFCSNQNLNVPSVI
jgi:hypothetical protein